jgi:hypothetical protein
MWRFLAGGASALLLVTVGIVWWTSRADHASAIPPAPKAVRAAIAGSDELDEPPAASEKTREQRRFARYDKDENGIITRAEMMDTRRKPFQKLDTNGDGKLSFDEWAIATSDRFGKADADRSGTLTASEFATTRRETRPAQRCTCET